MFGDQRTGESCVVVTSGGNDGNQPEENGNMSGRFLYVVKSPYPSRCHDETGDLITPLKYARFINLAE